jgi:predicted  nucleic acid-binding Zn-ribbon protein
VSENYQKLQTDSEKQVREGEEKIKKLKGLLGQASKSLQESKRLQIEKDGELERLRTKVEDAMKHLEEMKAASAEQKTSMVRLMRELQDEREISSIKIAELVSSINVWLFLASNHPHFPF